jgi:hypothetical protein
MRRSWLLALALLGAIALATWPVGVSAHEGTEGISVDPASLTAGETMLIAGSGLEPDDERVLVLRGEDVVVSLGSATTDGEGMLAAEVTVPAHLPTGSYQVQAIGDETLETELRVEAAAGAEGTTPETPEVPYDGPSPLESAVVIGGAIAVALAGVVLIRRAERLGRLAAS